MTVAEVLLPRLDHQFAVFDAGVVRSGGVILKFIVTPTTAARVVAPLAWIRRAAGWLIKFIAPHKLPAGWSGAVRGVLRKGVCGRRDGGKKTIHSCPQP